MVAKARKKMNWKPPTYDKTKAIIDPTSSERDESSNYSEEVEEESDEDDQRPKQRGNRYANESHRMSRRMLSSKIRAVNPEIMDD